MFSIGLFHDYILVEIEEPPKKTSSGILLPEASVHPVRKGRVLQTGPGRKYIDTYRGVDVKVGERVVFLIGSVDTKSGKAILHHLPNNQVLIREPDILFVIDDDSLLEVTI
jgi:co-chaperonin GroES (HSP10)